MKLFEEDEFDRRGCLSAIALSLGFWIFVFWLVSRMVSHAGQ